MENLAGSGSKIFRPLPAVLQIDSDNTSLAIVNNVSTTIEDVERFALR